MTALPDYKTPWERHLDAQARGDHPTIEDGDGWAKFTYRNADTLHARDGDELIALTEDSECPVCGGRGTIVPRYARKGDGIADPSWAFVRWADGSSEAVEQFKKRGFYPIICRPPGSAGRPRCFLGVARRKAVEAYEEFRKNKAEYGSFRSSARSLANRDYPEEIQGRGHSHGLLLATIYEMLGADQYDYRDLHGRTNVTKGHLVAIIRRLMHLEFQHRGDWTADWWKAEQDFGKACGVEWSIPGWVDQDDIVADDDFSRSVFE